MFKTLSRYKKIIFLHFLFLFALFDLFVYVGAVPNFAEVFKSFGAVLPSNLKLIIFVSDHLQWMNHSWALFVVPPISYAISVYFYKKGWMNEWIEIFLFLFLVFVFIFTFLCLFTYTGGIGNLPN